MSLGRKEEGFSKAASVGVLQSIPNKRYEGFFPVESCGIYLYIKLKSRPSVCLSTFQLGRSANSRTSLHIEAVFVPHKALIIYLCQEYQ